MGKEIAVCEPRATAVCGQEPLRNTKCAEALLSEEGVASGSQVPHSHQHGEKPEGCVKKSYQGLARLFLSSEERVKIVLERRKT